MGASRNYQIEKFEEDTGIRAATGQAIFMEQGNENRESAEIQVK